MDKIFHIGSTFKAYEDGDDLHITGMASTNSTDRSGDIIEEAAWTKGGLDNYLNNPIILFNHDYNQPIGRAVQLGTNDNGLQLKAKIAKSAGHVGELIKEGVLGAFSVGFRVKDAEYMVETDGYKIKDAELLEVSVVTVPANQAATFSLAKSFDSLGDYEEFKKSFKQEDPVPRIIKPDPVKHDQTPQDLETQVKATEKPMEVDIDKIVAQAVEKTATAMAMKEAERKAEEQKQFEAEQKAADQAQTQKSAEEARIITAVQSGTEKLMADVEAKLAAKDADFEQILGSLKGELSEKAEEIQKLNESKRVFADRGQKSSVSEEDMVNAHILGVVTKKGIQGTQYGRDIFEKASNDNAGVRAPGDDFEQIVSNALERDIQLELVLDPIFRKINMTASSLIVPTMPDAGYAEMAGNAFATGGAEGDSYKGNLEARDAASPGVNDGVDMGQVILQTSRIISRSYIANETEEDAIIPILPLIREAMVRAHARTVEHSILLGGHSTQAAFGTSYTGLVQLATAASKVLDSGSAGVPGAATADALLNMRQAMGKYGRRPGDVVYIISLDSYYDLLDDPDFQTVNEVGDQRATRITGEIANVYGSPVIVCDEFASGRSQAAPWAVAVNPRNFVVPVMRGATVESDYDVEKQRRVLVATQRRGFKNLFGDGAGGQVVTHTW